MSKEEERLRAEVERLELVIEKRRQQDERNSGIRWAGLVFIVVVLIFWWAAS